MNTKKLQHISLALTLSLLALIGVLALLGAGDNGPASVYAQGADGHDIYYVALSCTGVPTPCYTTVQAAVDAVDDSDDEIWVAGGAYTGVQAHAGSNQIAYISKTLTLRGGYSPGFTETNPSAYPTTLNAQSGGRVLFITNTVAVTVENLTLTGGSATLGGGVYAASDAEIHLTNNVIAGNAAATDYRGGGVDTDGASVWLINNVIQNNDGSRDVGALLINAGQIYAYGNTVDNSGNYGLYLSGDEMTVLDNRIVNNNDSGLMVGWGKALVSGNVITGNGTGSASQGGGIRALEVVSDSTFSNNIIAGNNATNGSGLYIATNGTVDTPQTLNLLHNTVADNSGGSEDVYVGGSYLTALFTNNIISGSNSVGVQEALDNAKDGSVQLEGTLWNTRTTYIAGDQIVTGTVDLHDEPALTGNYHLVSSSPAVDAGVDVGQFWDDVDGDPRPAGQGFDIGADERTGTALQMVKTVNDSRLAPGETLTYTISITVAGGSATALRITDTLPAQQQALAVTSDGGACSLVAGYGGGATCNPGTVGAGTHIPITLTAQMTTVQPSSDDLPLVMTNTLMARADEAAYQVYAHTQFGDCLVRVNGVTYESVQAAVDAAGAGDLVKVAGYCNALNTRGTEIAYVTKTLTLRGGYTGGDWSSATPDPALTTLDAGGGGRVLVITNTVAVTVENLTLTGGSAGRGGGVYAASDAEIHLTNNVIAGNAATDDYRGGGVDTDGASVWLVDNAIRDNDGSRDVGALLVNGAETYVEGNTVENNGYNGLYLSGGNTGYVTVLNNRIVNNGDSGLMVGWGAVLVDSNIITGNIAAGAGSQGGGIRALNCHLTATHNLIMDNAAQVGGGIYAQNLITDSLFSNNVVAQNAAANSYSGSGIYLYDNSTTTQTLHLVHNTIVSNTGGNNGIYVSTDGNSTLTALFTNTIIAGHTGAVGVDATDASVRLAGTLWHNNQHDIGASGVVTTTPDYHGDPAFASDGYHLTGDSAALDLVYDILVADDIDGDPRPIPNDGSSDIGADEYAYPVDLGLTKDLVGPGSRIAGEVISYTLTVTSAGQIRADALLTDTFTPASAVAGLTGTVTLGNGNCQANGAVLTCNLTNVPTDTGVAATVWVTTAGSFSGVLTNTAQITPAITVDPHAANNVAGPVTVTILEPAPDLWVCKSASAQYLQSGDTLTYTLQWGNRGGVTANNAVLTDTLPAGVNFGSAEGSYTRNGQILTWNLGNVTSGTSGVYHVTVTANDGLNDGTLLVNTVNSGNTSGEFDPSDNTDQVTSTVYATGGISLTITKDAFGVVNDEVEVEDEFNYTIVISNSGPVSTPFTLEDEIPQGTEYVSVGSQPLGAAYVTGDNKIYWNHSADLAAGASATVTLRVKVVECGGVECGVIRNVAQVRVPDVSYVWQTQRDLWVKCPDLAVSVQEPGSDGYPHYFHYNGILHDNDYHWRLVYQNLDKGTHTSLAASPRITLTLEGNAHFGSSVTPAPTESSAKRLIWNLGELAPGANAEIGYIEIVLDGYDNNGYTLEAEIGAQNGLQECQSQRANNNDDETIPAITADFQKQALEPKVAWQHDNLGNPIGAKFKIGYKMLLHYRNSGWLRPSASDLEIEDVWPTNLSLDWQDGHLDSWGEWDFRQESNKFYWNADWALEGSRGWLEAGGYISQTTTPGTTFHNHAHLSFAPDNDLSGSYDEEAEAEVEIPLLQPVILKPQSGLQVCPGEDIFVSGIAQQNATVNIYLNGTLKKTVSPNSLGTFNASLTTVAGGNIIAVEATHGGKTTGRDSVTVSAPGNLLWSPYGSSVMGTVTAGPQKGQILNFDIDDPANFQIPGVYGFNDMQWSFRTCGCPVSTHKMSFTVTADNGQYTDVDSAPGDSLSYATAFLEHAHNVAVSAVCYDPNNPGGGGTVTQTTNAKVLIDPDGYVFDIDQGGEYDDDLGGMFNPVQAISGVTVTCYVSEPTWGGWIPWPAHVYSQTNPQVTDDSYPDGITTTGYYAFYTPPGSYYIDVQGTDGYQHWRSPVVQVITEPVHVNVPYTPWPDQAAVSVTLTADGISSPVVTVPVGSAVQWTSALRASDTITDLVRWGENPILHPKSNINPILDTHGFDAGYLEPDSVYRRTFAWPGTYTYTDAHGNTGTVIVTGEPPYKYIYLPLVVRNYAP